MKAAEVRPGDEFRLADNTLIYTVTGYARALGVRTDFATGQEGPAVEIPVQFTQDGGYGTRMLFAGEDAPLTRPAAPDRELSFPVEWKASEPRLAGEEKVDPSA